MLAYQEVFYRLGEVTGVLQKILETPEYVQQVRDEVRAGSFDRERLVVLRNLIDELLRNDD